MTKKKYYWLKLKDDFFSDKKIKKLRTVAGGDTFTLIYLKMQLLSLKNDGFLVFEGLEDTVHEEIALEIDEDPNNVQFTLMYLLKHGLVEEAEDNKLAMIETMSNIGRESESANRVRNYRERQKALQCNVTEVTCNTEIEKEKEKEKEIDKDKEKEVKKESKKKTTRKDIYKKERELIVGHYNKITGSNIDPHEVATKRSVQKQLKLGVTVEEHIELMDFIWNKWSNWEKRDECFTLQSLFFNSYTKYKKEMLDAKKPKQPYQQQRQPVAAHHAPIKKIDNPIDLYNTGE